MKTNQFLVGARASEELKFWLAGHPLPTPSNVPISVLGLKSVKKTERIYRGRRSAGGWRGWLGQEVAVEEEEKFHVLEDTAGKQYYRSDSPHVNLKIEWLYAIRGTELWAVTVGFSSSFLDGKMDVKLADLPEPVVDGNVILPEGWVAVCWSTCGCGQEGGHAGKLLFESEVKDHLRAWLDSHGG